MAYTKEDFIRIGEGWTSDLVLAEARETRNRWKDDLPLLTEYGYGQTKLTDLENLIAQLEARYKLYNAQVGQKLAARPNEAAAITAARTWVKKCQGVLDDLVENDTVVEKSVANLGSRIPTTATKLKTFASGLLKIATDERNRLDPTAATDKFYKEGDKVIKDLEDASEVKVTRRDTKEVGTSELDELDGKIYVAISKLNKRARQAHADLGNDTRASQYVFAHLVRSDSSSTSTQPEPPPTPPKPTPTDPQPTATDSKPTPT
jgi:hypothetical protein